MYVSDTQVLMMARGGLESCARVFVSSRAAIASIPGAAVMMVARSATAASRPHPHRHPVHHGRRQGLHKGGVRNAGRFAALLEGRLEKGAVRSNDCRWRVMISMVVT